MNSLRMAMLITLMAGCTAVFAQGGDRHKQGKDEIEAMKIGFLTKRLELTPDEAKVFWPVYESFQSERGKLHRERKDRRKQMRSSMNELSDAEVEKEVDAEIAFRQSELDVMTKYHVQFKQVLPVKKVARLYRAEEEFKRELLQRLQRKQQDNRSPRMRRGSR